MRKAVIIALAITATVTLLLASCAAPDQKAEDDYMKAVRQGNYSLITPGQEEGAEDMAIMDVEGDTYKLAPKEGMGKRKRIGGMSPEEAIMKADEKLGGRGVRLRAVREDGGEVIGYEVYPPASLGPGSPPGPEAEAVLLPNLLRIDYNVDPSGRRRVRVMPIPLRSPDMVVPPK